MYYGEAPSAFAFESITVAGTAIGPTAATISPTGAPGAVRATLTLETAQVRYRYDGTAPTATEGHLLEVGDVLTLEGHVNISRLLAIRTGGTSGVIKASYER